MRSVVVGSKQSSIRAVSSLASRPVAYSIVLGYVGENQATCVVWPGMADAWRRLYGGGKIEGAHQRYGDGGPYPIVLTETDAGDVVWTLSASDLAREGAGAVELSFFKDGVLAKSKQWRTIVLPSITGGGTVDPPEPQKSWVDAVLAAGVQASASASAAAASAEKAEAALPHAPVIGADGAWSVWDATEGAYKSTGVSATGATGPQGPKGDTGATGPQGPKGEDGKTPEYGVDYGTPEQIQGIAQSAADLLQPELNQIKQDLANKLPKSPLIWEPWTAEEQQTARERIGINNAAEFVETIELTESVSSVVRNYDTAGVAYNFKAMRIRISNTTGDSTTASVIVNGIGSTYSAIQKNSYAPILLDCTSGFLNVVSTQATAADEGARNPVMPRTRAIGYIMTSIQHIEITGVLPAGTKIEIYGVRS